MSTKLFYNRFVDDWMHALPLGNGRIGDRICLHLDAMSNIGRDGLFLYRQRIGYLDVTDGD